VNPFSLGSFPTIRAHELAHIHLRDWLIFYNVYLEASRLRYLERG
jgi:hypothetical protein